MNEREIALECSAGESEEKKEGEEEKEEEEEKAWSAEWITE